MRRSQWAGALVVLAVMCAIFATVQWMSIPIYAAPVPAGTANPAQGWGLIGAALAAGLSALGAGIAVASVGAAAVGALAEKPELFGRVMILVGLAEGIAIYGLIVAVLIFNRLG